MTTPPANTIQDELCKLVSTQIEVFKQPAPLTSEQVREFRERTKKIRILQEELDRVSLAAFRENRSGKAS